MRIGVVSIGLTVIEGRSTMLNKLFVIAAAAAAISVPLAGAASADPGDPSGNGIGQGGVPHRTEAFGDAVAAANPGLPPLNPNGSGPLPPGQFFKNLAKVPDMNTPDAAAVAVNGIYGAYSNVPGIDPPGTPVQTNLEAVPPGMATKTFTPGCTSGHTATDPNINGGGPVCH
jgi:hypothetical protein